MPDSEMSIENALSGEGLQQDGGDRGEQHIDPTPSTASKHPQSPTAEPQPIIPPTSSKVPPPASEQSPLSGAQPSPPTTTTEHTQGPQKPSDGLTHVQASSPSPSQPITTMVNDQPAFPLPEHPPSPPPLPPPTAAIEHTQEPQKTSNNPTNIQAPAPLPILPTGQTQESQQLPDGPADTHALGTSTAEKEIGATSLPFQVPEDDKSQDEDAEEKTTAQKLKRQGSPGTFLGDRLEFLESHLLEYLALGSRTKAKKEWWFRLIPHYLELFPIEEYPLPQRKDTGFSENSAAQLKGMSASERCLYCAKHKCYKMTDGEQLLEVFAMY
ncbi:hypothetical protein PM082_014224 [Marasmius tenuissimus]|nr:hypothetical protein PM082_014224 [Marasmius tenuissimus]